MPRLKIKQLEDKIATAGLFMGGGPVRRKLQPGEVIDVPEDFESGMYDGKGLLDAMWGTGKVEMTLDAVTRPIDFDTEREAKLTSPTFKSRGPDEDIEIDKARVAVAARLAETSDTPLKSGSPVDDKQPEPSDDPPAALGIPPVNPRAARRAALQAAERGSEVPT